MVSVACVLSCFFIRHFLELSEWSVRATEKERDEESPNLFYMALTPLETTRKIHGPVMRGFSPATDSGAVWKVILDAYQFQRKILSRFPQKRLK